MHYCSFISWTCITRVHQDILITMILILKRTVSFIKALKTIPLTSFQHLTITSLLTILNMTNLILMTHQINPILRCQTMATMNLYPLLLDLKKTRNPTFGMNISIRT
uniref:Uncharacterized protein n=1 Tax=Cacopsylla melanoneura TaxID=428564 RepID=A0A8D9A9U7_9HEMI